MLQMCLMYEAPESAGISDSRLHPLGKVKFERNLSNNYSVTDTEFLSSVFRDTLLAWIPDTEQDPVKTLVFINMLSKKYVCFRASTFLKTHEIWTCTLMNYWQITQYDIWSVKSNEFL